jgi:hypothetical protein
VVDHSILAKHPASLTVIPAQAGGAFQQTKVWSSSSKSGGLSRQPHTDVAEFRPAPE